METFASDPEVVMAATTLPWFLLRSGYVRSDRRARPESSVDYDSSSDTDRREAGGPGRQQRTGQQGFISTK